MREKKRECYRQTANRYRMSETALPRPCPPARLANEKGQQVRLQQKQERIQVHENGICAHFTRTSCYGFGSETGLPLSSLSPPRPDPGQARKRVACEKTCEAAQSAPVCRPAGRRRQKLPGQAASHCRRKATKRMAKKAASAPVIERQPQAGRLRHRPQAEPGPARPDGP